MHADLDYALVQVEGEHPERLILAAELVKDVMDRAGIEQFHNLGYAKGAALELLRFNHPFYSFDVPVVLGDHVTLDAGTGAVHTAPGHGQEDFVVGQKYGLEVANPVGSNGVYLPDTELFAGQHVFKANASVVEVLTERGALLHHKVFNHPIRTAGVTRPRSSSVPPRSGSSAWSRRVCASVLLKRSSVLRKRALPSTVRAAGCRPGVKPHPGDGREPSGLVYLPSAHLGCAHLLFVHKETQALHPDSVRLMEEVAKRVEQSGIQAWWDLDKAELLGADADNYEKVPDSRRLV